MSRPSVKDQRERELVEAAIRCVARKGLQATTITDVSEEAGLSRGIINFYFASKENLLEEALRRLLGGFAERADKEAARAPDAQATLDAFWQAHFSPEICNQKRMNVWLEYAGAATSHKAFAALFAAYRRQWERRLAEYAGRAHKPQLVVESSRLFAFLSGLWMQCALEAVAEKRAHACGQWLAALAALDVSQGNPRGVSGSSAAKPAVAVKKAASATLSAGAGQLDFGDLFARKG